MAHINPRVTLSNYYRQGGGGGGWGSCMTRYPTGYLNYLIGEESEELCWHARRDGHCRFGRDCKYKTMPCNFYRRTGRCIRNGKCPYAHRPTELRPSTPRSKRYKTIPCYDFHLNGCCLRGNRCHFIHRFTVDGKDLHSNLYDYDYYPCRSSYRYFYDDGDYDYNYVIQQIIRGEVHREMSNYMAIMMNVIKEEEGKWNTCSGNRNNSNNRRRRKKTSPVSKTGRNKATTRVSPVTMQEEQQLQQEDQPQQERRMSSRYDIREEKITTDDDEEEEPVVVEGYPTIIQREQGKEGKEEREEEAEVRQQKETMTPSSEKKNDNITTEPNVPCYDDIIAAYEYPSSTLDDFTRDKEGCFITPASLSSNINYHHDYHREEQKQQEHERHALLDMIKGIKNSSSSQPHYNTILSSPSIFATEKQPPQPVLERMEEKPIPTSTIQKGQFQQRPQASLASPFSKYNNDIYYSSGISSPFRIPERECLCDGHKNCNNSNTNKGLKNSEEID